MVARRVERRSVVLLCLLAIAPLTSLPAYAAPTESSGTIDRVLAAVWNLIELVSGRELEPSDKAGTQWDPSGLTLPCTGSQNCPSTDAGSQVDPSG